MANLPLFTGQGGIDLIKTFEGCRLTAYQDSVGIWTIGYGHTGADVYSGKVIEQDEAENLLKQDLHTTEVGISHAVTVDLNQNQYDALVCFAYNVGLGNLRSSTLLKLLNTGDYDGAAGQFVKWDRAGGQVLAGLLRRREAEQTLFQLPMTAPSINA